MNQEAFHTGPSLTAVAREQARAVGLTLRREGVLLALLLVAFTVLIIISYIRAQSEPNANVSVDMDPEAGVPAIILALFAAMSVWRNEEPSRRSYFWSLPVSRARHSLVKVATGWGWLMLAMLVYFGWVLALALITGGEIGIARSGVYLGTPGGEFDRSMMERLEWTVPSWQWVTPFAGATIMYLIGSGVVLLSDHPWRWFVGSALGFFLLMGMLQAAELDDLARRIMVIFDGKYGLTTALDGMAPVMREFTRPDGARVAREMSMPAFGTWVASTLLWLGIAGGGVVAAAKVHQER